MQEICHCTPAAREGTDAVRPFGVAPDSFPAPDLTASREKARIENIASTSRRTAAGASSEMARERRRLW